MQTIPMGLPTYDGRTAVPCWITYDSGCVLAFSTRLGGVSTAPFDSLNLGRSTADDPASVTENRRRLLERLGFDPARLANAGQVHGVRVLRVATAGLHPDADALVTTEHDLAVAVTAADCVPLVYVVPGAIAVAHSGWRGTADGMPRAALEAVCAAGGTSAGHVHVYIGPSIRSCCYCVGADVAERFPIATRRVENGAWHLDLAAAARIQLADAGVDSAHVADIDQCTACDRVRYYSHRRDHGTTGRLWAVAAIPGR
jgi:YfiH family protein